MRKIITDDLLKKIVAIQLILVLTMVDFLMISINVISYAVGIVSTNEPNVEFKAYFLNESNEEVSEYNLPLKSEDVKLHLQITVKNSGYFNGQISLENANFDLIKDILPEGVSKIVDNTIFLSQISAEKTLDIQVGIRAKLDKNPTNLTDTVNLKLSGTYRNGESGEDKSVEAKTNLKVNIVSSYTSEDNPAILTQELLTNRVYTVNGENKRIVQTLIKSKIENNAYPISWTGLILSLPENAEVSIAKIKTNATNPDVILKEGENVWLADGCLNVLLENVEKQDGSIYWDNGEDSLVATYVLSENETLQETSIGSAIMLCDESLFITELNTLQITEEKDGIISLDIEEKKESIYKGKIYTGEEREYTENVSVSVNYLGIANKVNVSLDQSNYLKGEETKEANIEYRSIKINKQKFQEIFGEEGKIVTSINNITITKDSEVDEEGNVVITVPEGVNKIEIETSEPKTLGVLDIEVTKVIKENKYQKDEIEKLNYIQNNVSGKYVVLGEDDHNIAKKWSNIELKDTVTSASFEMGTTTLSSSKKNEVEMKIVLDTKGEDKKLYKNPTFSIEFPEEVHNVEIKSANGAFLASTLTKKDENVEDKDGKKVINVTFVGEQTKYSENSVEGEASIIITADVELDAKSTNKTGTVTLKYTNANDEEGKVNTLSKEIKIDALKQVILVNAISEYGVETLGEEESKQIKLEKQIIAKEVYNTMQIINNEENAIGNVKILGSFPTKNENTNTIEAKITEAISVQGIKEGDYSIYYTENENATDDKDNIENGWTNEISNNQTVRKYLIIINKIEASQIVGMKYKMLIPPELQGSQTASMGYQVTYTNSLTQAQNTKIATQLKLETEPDKEQVQTNLKATLSASVGGEKLENGAEVKAGEIIKYSVTVENTGNFEAKDVKIDGLIPDGTTFLELNTNRRTTGMSSQLGDEIGADMVENYYNKVQDKSKYSTQIGTVAIGEIVIKEYEVEVNKEIESNTQISNKVNIVYNDVIIETEEITNILKEADIRVQVYPMNNDTTNVILGEKYQYEIEIENLTNVDKENIQIQLCDSKLIQNISAFYRGGEEFLNIENNSIVIENLPANETIHVEVISKIESGESDNLSYSIKSIYKDKVYRANMLKYKINKIEFKMEQVSINKDSENQTFIKAGDNIEYVFHIQNTGDVDQVVEFEDVISNYLTIKTVKIDDKENEDVILENGKIDTYLSIQSGQAVIITVSTVVNKMPSVINVIPVSNKAILSIDGINVAESNEVTYYFEPTDEENNGDINLDLGDSGKEDENQNSDTNPDSNPDTDSDSEVEKKFVIAGTAWLDENEDGKKSNNEELLAGITVKLLDVSTGKILTDANGEEVVKKTDEKGFYAFSSVLPGEYIVIFEYDTNIYILTTYKANNTNDSESSNVILNTLTINGKSQEVACTDTIKVDSSSVANINIGLKKIKKFDLELTKTISKIVVQTSDDTKTYNYSDSNLAKVEIAAKKLKGANVVIEYKIKVKNTGELAGYAKNIVDYMPSELIFNSNLNSDWYQSGKYLYNTSLKDTKIDAGQTKEISLVLTKTMTEENTGLINNIAEIYSVYNTSGNLDIDSTPANKIQGEDDMSSADIIIGVKTGAMVTYIALTLSISIVIGVCGYIISKKVIEID